MKNKRKVISFLQQENKRYCKQINLEAPTLIFDDTDLKQLTANKREFKDAKQSCLGLSWHHRDTKLQNDYIYLNLNNTDYVAQMIETLVHELVHIKFPNLKHSDNFYNKVNSIMLGDKYA